ncbi:MAG TPA: hypothetical protein PKK15_05370 [Kouleothrix sp.]|uniref:hypothetical protein n=1 Tax=Kouleothrix sp. TaxID=2779161 RepID=UPI002CF0A758|nr:hypothetical protein [Kouleothrix sp.]
MARRKRQNPFLSMAQVYLNQHMPDMSGARLQLRMLDGPPGSPRYAVTAEVCRHICPYGVLPAQAALGKCTVFDCPLRQSVRLLLDRRGAVLHATRNTLHWN